MLATKPLPELFLIQSVHDDALYHMRITTDDITPSDGAHLIIAGLRKQAEIEWRVLDLGR